MLEFVLYSFRRKCSYAFSPGPARISVSGLELFVHLQALCAVTWSLGQEGTEMSGKQHLPQGVFFLLIEV